MRRRNSSNNAACYRKIIIKTHDSGYSNVAVTARTQPTDIKKTLHCSTQDHSLDTHPEQNRLEQHQEQKAYQQQYWSIPAKASTANAVCYHPCKTDPLPWWQQHLVLNQTVYNANSCQPPCQIPCLTVDTGSTATACKGQHSNSLEARIKPKLYFEQLLKRNGCHRKPRPPVKVDVNVRIVPKKSRENPSTSQKTFIKELDEVTQTLNETFIKDNSSERANIIDHLVYFDNDLDNDDDRKQVTQLKIVHEQ
ncbi:CG31291 [Drosophila busckii]|uniref:CG31291 n=1 Tax=Drosophila busckii TaxID=30019 RepID=A0A0M4EMW5_DROBS|nr:CG31291 [Drosophila busckii]